MKKEAIKNKGSDFERQQLDEEIQELMKSLEKQNALLSGYYEKVRKKDNGKARKRHTSEDSGSVVKHEKDC